MPKRESYLPFRSGSSARAKYKLCIWEVVITPVGAAKTASRDYSRLSCSSGSGRAD
jgi:hypothetical protein